MRKERPADEAAVRRELAPALSAVRQALAPVPADRVVKALALMAELFGVEVPTKEGMHLYAFAVAAMTTIGFEQGVRRVMMTHKYPRLPLPAEIIEAGKSATVMTEVWEARISKALAQLI